MDVFMALGSTKTSVLRRCADSSLGCNSQIVILDVVLWNRMSAAKSLLKGIFPLDAGILLDRRP